MYGSRVTPTMTRIHARLLAAASLSLAAAGSLFAQAAPGKAKPEPAVVAEVAVRNDAAFARRETIEVPIKDIPGLSKPADMEKVHVALVSTGAAIVSQGMDTNGDYDDDTLVFQADLPAKATVRYRLTLGEVKRYGKEDFRVYGRFVRERFDDFAWENDRVAFRMYGEALESWERGGGNGNWVGIRRNANGLYTFGTTTATSANHGGDNTTFPVVSPAGRLACRTPDGIAIYDLATWTATATLLLDGYPYAATDDTLIVRAADRRALLAFDWKGNARWTRADLYVAPDASKYGWGRQCGNHASGDQLLDTID